MTQNEVSVIKNAVLDATEAYVDARLSVLDFVRTQIGVVLSSTERNHKYYHTVRCNATQSNPNGIIYNNVLSVGNIPFPENSVVFLIAPNAQFSNQFILGKLDDTPCNISAGSIRLGGTNISNAPIYLTGTPIHTQQGDSYGHIATFNIYNDRLEFTGENNAISFIKGTAFRISEFVTYGGSGYRVSMMMDGNNARIVTNTEAHPNGGLIASNAQGWDGNGNFYNPLSGDYTWIKPTAITSKTSLGEYTLGAQIFKFLGQSQSVGDIGNLRIDVGESAIIFRNVSSGKWADLTLS